MRREIFEIRGTARKIEAAETKSPVHDKTVRASKANPQIHRMGTAAQTEAIVTTSLRVIRKWVEERGGKPAVVKNAGDREGADLLRIDFPELAKDEPLRKIPWPEWFKKLQASELAFLFKEKTKDGKYSYFFQLIKVTE